PLFCIHLNVDFPFTLTGILYFPKIKNNLDIRKDRIQLYCNQVFVTDSVEGVVPEFLMLLQGVIDSPDIPLNVSRSYLQADRNVKKISTYITKKVASRLEEIAKNDAQEFEQKWNDIKIFIEYGMLSDEKFCEQAMKFALLENTDGKFFKLDDYKKLIEGEQTDKDGNLIYLYATDKDAQYTYIKAATDKGYDVLMMNGQLDVPFLGMLEQKNEKSRFVRVDSDVLDRLIVKEDTKQVELTEAEREVATTLFSSQIPVLDKAQFMVDLAPMAATDSPVLITQSEYMRRMKEMSQFQAGMSFYGEMPDYYNLTLNVSHPLVKKLIDDAVAATEAQLKPLNDDLNATNNVIKALRDLDKDGKGVPDDKKQDLSDNEKKAGELREQKTAVISDYAAGQQRIKQLIDIALLGNGLLKGEALDRFLKRSVELL
ncbi:MAG: molecular chaperone HtpG, partial [Muribaculaceae bacterium]|nr:molecular chaperone HtpG [Muribaculaceae bacterium]